MRQLLSLLVLLLSATKVFGHGRVSRHLLIEDLSMVAILADAETTEGPFDEDVTDYVYTSDMTAAGAAGSPGVTTDRSTVLDGIPLSLTVTVYDLSNQAEGFAEEYRNVDVFLWHTDASGVYSAVEQARQSKEGTDGQVWLRAYQTTGANGVATFQTILPGWYTGRVIHIHARFRAAGSSNWAATTQFFVNDTALDLYEGISPYSDNTASQTSLASDNIYRNLGSTVGDLLTLKMQGSTSEGFSAALQVGLLCEECDNTAPVDTGAPTFAPTTAPEPTSAPTSAPVATCSAIFAACESDSDCCSNRCTINQCRSEIKEDRTKLSGDRGGAGGGGTKTGGATRRLLGRSHHARGM